MAFFIYEPLIILFICIFREIASNCTGVYCAIEVSGTYPQILPRKTARSSVAYDESTDTIIILGGNSQKQYVTFDKLTFNDKGENYMTDGVYGTGQYWSQLDNTIWMINDDTPTFITMNTITRGINYPSNITIPIDVGTRGCLATMNYNNNQFLFVVGGYNTNDGYLNLIQVYNINSQQWTNLPSMQTPRRSASCIIKSNILYVIGGKNDGLRIASVEYFNIGNYFSNIPNQQWIYTNDNLSVAIDSAVAVSYGNDIIIVGGMDINDLYPTDINAINTITKDIRMDGSLVSGVLNPSVIVVDNVLYVIGGSTVNGITDIYQLINLYPTLSPTVSPTLNPSYFPTESPIVNPTKTPTLNPSKIPTISPTVNPSYYPTIHPSKLPSNMPTVTPSSNPSNTPTKIPSNMPTMFPTKHPTNLPTKSPTNMPTNMPSYNPTKTISTTKTSNHISPTSKSPTYTPTDEQLDSVSGEIRDDIMSTVIGKQNKGVDNTNSNITTAMISMFAIGFGSAICCCLIALILYRYLTKTRKRKLSDDRKRKTQKYNLNISEGLPDTDVQLTKILPNENRLSINITTTNETETYINNIIHTDSDDEVNVNDITLNNDTVTAGFIANGLTMGNDNETAGILDENKMINTITAGFIEIDENNNEENNDILDGDDNEIMTPRFKKTAGDEFMTEGEETDLDDELNFETIQ